MILPALTEAAGPYWRSIKYSLFPPLGLATLAGHLGPDDVATIEDEHVQTVDLADEPDLVVIKVYVSNAYRAYALADHYRRLGAHVCLGGLHVTSLPAEAAAHADTIFLGPGDDTFPAFLADFRAGAPGTIYRSTVRSLIGLPRARRDLIQRWRYLIPNTVVVSRCCPHACDFCYKNSFFAGGKSFYTQAVDEALAEIDTLPGRHVYFLDDNLLGDVRFAEALFAGLRGMNRVWQAAGTVQAVLRPGLIEQAVRAGMRSLFVGFETLSQANLAAQHKLHSHVSDYEAAIRRLHECGAMVNASFVFGLDEDGPDVFDRTVDWAAGQGIETSTFHILTPYPGSPAHARLAQAGRILHDNWNLYDTRHAVFRPARMSPEDLEQGYRRAYESFYRWREIFRGAWTKPTLPGKLKHLVYSGAWKKLEPLWSWIIRSGKLPWVWPMMEKTLAGFSKTREVLSGRVGKHGSFLGSRVGTYPNE